MDDAWYRTGLNRAILYTMGVAFCGTMATLHSAVWLFPGAVCVGLSLLYQCYMRRELKR